MRIEKGDERDLLIIQSVKVESFAEANSFDKFVEGRVKAASQESAR